MSLQEFAFGETEGPGVFMRTSELLGRPHLAMSEAIGAAAAGEDPWEALGAGWRGERKRGTLGEQVFKVEPAEDTVLEALFKQAGALGLDIATDPTLIVGAPAVTKTIGAVERARKAGGLVSKILPSAKTIMRKFPGLARLTVPITTHLRWIGGRAGAKAAGLWDVADDARNLRTAQAAVELERAARQLGVHRSAQLRDLAREHLESGALRLGIVHPDARVQNFAAYVGETLQKVGVEAEAFRDPLGKGFQIVEPVLRSAATEVKTAARKLGITSAGTRRQVWEHLTVGSPLPEAKGAAKLAEVIRTKLPQHPFGPGSVSVFSKEFYRRPFKSIPDYYPHLATPDFLRSLETDEGLSKAARVMAKTNGISEFEAEKILRNLGTPRRAGNIEYARTLDMPGYERDPLLALPRYFEQVFGRIEYARQFGVEGQVLSGLLKKAVMKRIKTPSGFRILPGLTKADAMLIRDTILGRPMPKTGLERVARAVMNYQVMTKMGPQSAIMNISQNANTIVREGGTNFLKGAMRGMTDEGARQGAIAYSGGIHEHLLRMMGASGKSAQWWLKWSGFTPAERLNRINASNAGIVAAERLLRQSAGKLTDDLAMRGLTAEDIPRIVANNWKLPTDVADRVGLLASNATQHVTRLKDIPLAWQSPSMRTAVQFKSFVYQQTRFLMREVLSPALKYFETNGKEGAIGPLARFAVTFGLGGGVVGYARDQWQQLASWLTKMEHEPREPVPDDWLLRVMEDALNMGGMGVAGDLVQRAARRDFKGWLLGPTGGDISDLVELMATSGARAYKRRELDLTAVGAEALRHVPVVSPVLPKRKLRETVEERLGDLGILLRGGPQSLEDLLEGT